MTFLSVAGFGVGVDFVELPSQLLEHWLEIPSVLTELARHADTGQPIPADLRDRLLKAHTFSSSHYLTTVVPARVNGEFPASPATLSPTFKLDGDRIAELEIG